MTRPSAMLEAAADFAATLADAARAAIAEAPALRAELKPDRSFVTDLDRTVERRLRRLIADRFPDHGVIGEEEGADRPDAPCVWVLDPIDGTAPLLAGVPVWGVLIAFAVEGAPAVGVIDAPAAGARWVGVRGRSTLLNGAPCAVRPCARMADAVMSASNPDFFDAQNRPALDALRAATAWRIYGASCLAYGRLAEGRIDVALDAGLSIYDWAAFAPVIDGAGGIISDWSGAPLRLDGGSRVLAAGDPARHAEALAMIGAVTQVSRECGGGVTKGA